MLTEEQMRDALRQCPHDTVENLRVRWLYAKDFARAIESAATAPLLARIAELTRELEEARKDAAAEREQCAKVAKAISDKYAFGHYGNEVDTADEIEAAIRARGKT